MNNQFSSSKARQPVSYAPPIEFTFGIQNGNNFTNISSRSFGGNSPSVLGNDSNSLATMSLSVFRNSIVILFGVPATGISLILLQLIEADRQLQISLFTIQTRLFFGQDQ
ncbi:MAG: hypothetical protein WKF90_08820 [Pyrinomonadaceae bacterium]